MDDLLSNLPAIVVITGIVLFLIGLLMIVSVFMSPNSASGTLMGGIVLGAGGFALISVGHRM
jgi:uncharacterized membrane protein HdeD (DUF308 family)